VLCPVEHLRDTIAFVAERIVAETRDDERDDQVEETALAEADIRRLFRSCDQDTRRLLRTLAQEPEAAVTATDLGASLGMTAHRVGSLLGALDEMARELLERPLVHSRSQWHTADGRRSVRRTLSMDADVAEVIRATKLIVRKAGSGAPRKALRKKST